MKEEQYIPTEKTNYVSIKEWGKDHWSTFAYFETLTVDRNGIIDKRRMRCNPRIHRELVNISNWGDLVDGSQYPTRLQNGEIEKHDDWSCAEDMTAYGLVELFIFPDTKRINQAFSCLNARVKLTPKGREIADKLRKHKSEGGSFGNFVLSKMEIPELVFNVRIPA